MTAAVLARIDESPRGAFAAFVAIHLLLWTLLPTALYPNLPLDLIEALTYGPEWQLGYDKLPPLPWWLIEIVHQSFGVDVAYYLLAEIVVLAAFAIVWRCALPIVGAAGALAGVLIIDGLHYFNFTAPKFNHDVIQLPFWALAGFSFHAALRTGRLRYWALLGCALGIAFWAKYFIVVFALPLALFVWFDRDAHRALFTPGPYLAAALGLIVASPHFLWLVANDFLPLHYAATRAAVGRNVWDHLGRPLFFVVAQLFWMLPALLIAMPLVLPRPERRAPAADTLDRRVVTLLAFGPAACLVALSFATARGLITMWGYPLWLFLGVWMVMTARAAIDGPRLNRIVAIWAAVSAVYGVAFVARYAVVPYFDAGYRASLFPGRKLANRIAYEFRMTTGTPIKYVIADMWLGGNIHYYAAEHPRTLIDGKPERAPWIDLADLQRHGAAVVWTGDDRTTMPASFAAVASGAKVQPPFELPMHWGNGTTKIGWAILPPAP